MILITRGKIVQLTEVEIRMVVCKGEKCSCYSVGTEYQLHKMN